MNLVLGVACYSQNNIYPRLEIKDELARNSLVFLSVGVPAPASLAFAQVTSRLLPPGPTASGVYGIREEGDGGAGQGRRPPGHRDRKRRCRDGGTPAGAPSPGRSIPTRDAPLRKARRTEQYYDAKLSIFSIFHSYLQIFVIVIPANTIAAFLRRGHSSPVSTAVKGFYTNASSCNGR